MKSEPSVYSIDDLERDRKTGWDGVRNFQARNFMRDQMTVGDEVLYYHSSAQPTGVAGIARVSGAARPDPTAWDPKSKYRDPKSTPDDPRWFMVEVEFVEKFAEVVALETLKATPDLDGMMVLQRGSRLSVQPVDKTHFAAVVKLGRGRRA
jgi:predicted RNA-binding protein with PUA-like domain